MLSERTETRLEAARKAEATYRPNDEICQQLHEKSLIMLVGPAATGKSFLMNYVAEHDPAFSRVSVFTTRDARPDDEPGMFRTYPHTDTSVDELLGQIEQREVVQYAIHPTSGRIYGSTLNDYRTEFNLLATLSGIVNQLRNIPFKQTFVIALSVPPSTWWSRFNHRYPNKSEERTKRLKEALLSLEWLLSKERQKYIHWLDNPDNQITTTVQNLINIVKYNDHAGDEARQNAQQLYADIKRTLEGE